MGMRSLRSITDVFSCWNLGVVTLLLLPMHLNHVSCVHLHLVRRTYFWHFTNPRHAIKTGYVIPVLPGVSRVPYGDTVLHVNYIVGLPGVPEAQGLCERCVIHPLPLTLNHLVGQSNIKLFLLGFCLKKEFLLFRCVDDHQVSPHF